MDSTSSRVKQKKNPFETASFVSRTFFWWNNTFLWEGSKRDLTKEDLYKVIATDESQVLGNKLEHEWNKELEKRKKASEKKSKYNPSLNKAIARAFGPGFLFWGIYVFYEEILLRIFQPLFMSWFIRYFSSEDHAGIGDWEVCAYGAGVVLMSALYTFTHHQYFFGVMHTGMILRVAHCSFIYRKALRLSNKAIGESTIGQMVNLLSNDVNRFDSYPMFLHYLWAGPLQFVLVMYLSWKSIGNATFVGGALILLFVPFQSWIGKKFSQLRSETAKKTDIRIRIMSEIIQGIKVIKMYAWENSFAKLAADARKEEIKIIQKTCLYKSINSIFFFCSSRIVMALIFSTYVFMGDILTAEKAFLTLAFYNVVKLSMTNFFPLAIQFISETSISIKRIQNFLLMEEVSETSSTNVIETTLVGKTGSLRLKEVSGKWSEQSEGNTLDRITFEAKSGHLVAIVGPVGSGKGSILQAILGEMPCNEGSIKINGTLSYAAQESWIFSGTLRQNVLFGETFDAERYWNVLKVCALQQDIQKFEYGDLTLVGERGVSLSGGQKARVNLARAIYRNADIYLLDDPLSAVDAHVGKHLFEECITTFLRNKVVILVTHQIQYLKTADTILVMHQGKITHEGNFDYIMKSCEDISSFLIAESDEEEDEIEEEKKLETLEEEKPKFVVHSGGKEQKEVEETSKLGSVSKDVYFGYVRNGGNVFSVLALILLTIVTFGAHSFSDIWISIWTNVDDLQLDTYNHHNSSDNNFKNSTLEELDSIEEYNQYHLMVYGITIACLVVAAATHAIQFFLICMKSSRNLHNNMFHKLLQAQPRFFDVNPTGRILNRFSKDIGSIDEILPMSIFDVLRIFAEIICVFVIVIYASPYVAIPTIFVGIIFYIFRRFYLKTSRSVKRLEGVTKSPVFSTLSSSLNGLTSIRAFKAEEMMMNEFDHHQDVHSSAFFASLATTRWFGLYLDWMVVIYLSCCVSSFLLMPTEFLGGDVGLAINACLFLTGALQYGMRQSAEAENLMCSVERVMEYGDLKCENYSPAIENKVNETDPFSTGIVEFQDVSLRYDENAKLILKNISFKTAANDKIGIVGRTGAGKSSLITALFRLSEPTGKILIDNIDIGKMGLHDLRKNISIIPQDPLLFASSLRKNLDPFDEYSDADIWNSLDQAHFTKAVEDLKDGLDAKMSEGGSNLSVGQRQLVCLARAILRKNKILVLDEATANVDPKTDAMIQETIRYQFKDCTVFTVAHRLHTVMDSDKILVLDDGEIAEFDSPGKLLENPDGHLFQLVDQTGPNAKRKLSQMAKY